MQVNIRKAANDVREPQYQTKGSSGMDIRAYTPSWDTTIYAGDTVPIPTGIYVEIPRGYEIQIRSRSGMALKGLVVINQPGTIDSDYRGEIKVLLHNLKDYQQIVKHGERIAQIVLAPITECTWVNTDKLYETERGEGGFGHTGTE